MAEKYYKEVEFHDKVTFAKDSEVGGHYSLPDSKGTENTVLKFVKNDDDIIVSDFVIDYISGTTAYYNAHAYDDSTTIGTPYFNTDFNYPLFWNGTNLVNSTGSTNNNTNTFSIKTNLAFDTDTDPAYYLNGMVKTIQDADYKIPTSKAVFDYVGNQFTDKILTGDEVTLNETDKIPSSHTVYKWTSDNYINNYGNESVNGIKTFNSGITLGTSSGQLANEVSNDPTMTNMSENALVTEFAIKTLIDTVKLQYREVSNTATANSWERIAFDVSVSSYSCDMPLNPAIGDVVEFFDIKQNCHNLNMTLNGNGRPFKNNTTSFVLDVKGLGITFCNTDEGWIVIGFKQEAEVSDTFIDTLHGGNSGGVGAMDGVLGGDAEDTNTVIHDGLNAASNVGGDDEDGGDAVTTGLDGDTDGGNAAGNGVEEIEGGDENPHPVIGSLVLTASDMLL